MLVLTRRMGETLVIDGSIRVTVVTIDRNHVRLGIEAPSSVSVDRQEVYARKQLFACPTQEVVGCTS